MKETDKERDKKMKRIHKEIEELNPEYSVLIQKIRKIGAKSVEDKDEEGVNDYLNLVSGILSTIVYYTVPEDLRKTVYSRAMNIPLEKIKEELKEYSVAS